ncbi:MAG TPA: hypothetical protein VGQ95_11345 [Chthoniobacterales bacterium]|nr:hypothetical protein [Chthoniobacterales bacterium]
MKNIKLHTSRIARRIAAASAAVIVCFAFTATSARADDKNDKNLLISFDENFTSNTTIDGTTTLAGAFSDKGSRHQDFTVTPENANEVIVTGTIYITGSLGTLTTKFTGEIPVSNNPTFIEGTEYITGGTGAYAGASGKGTFEATIDFDTGNIVGVAELKVKTKK